MTTARVVETEVKEVTGLNNTKMPCAMTDVTVTLMAPCTGSQHHITAPAAAISGNHHIQASLQCKWPQRHTSHTAVQGHLLIHDGCSQDHSTPWPFRQPEAMCLGTCCPGHQLHAMHIIACKL